MTSLRSCWSCGWGHIPPTPTPSLTCTASPSLGLKGSLENRKKNKSIDSFFFFFHTFPVGNLTDFTVYTPPSGETFMTGLDLGEGRVQCSLDGAQRTAFCAMGFGHERVLSPSAVRALLSGSTAGKQCLTQTREFRNQILRLLIIILIKKKNRSFNNNIISFCFSLIKPISFSFLSVKEE